MNNTFTHGHALIVGVGADLPNTVDDALGIAGILCDPERCAYPDDQVQTLTGEGAGRGQILAALDKLAQNTTADDTVLVYFSGHGYRVSSTTGEAFYLLPYGYDLQRLYQTAVSGAEFTAALRTIPARKLLVLLDCCHAGGVGEAKGPGVTLAKAPLPPEALALLAEGSGRVLIASSKEDELSYAGRPYSAFTLALIEALCGQGVAKQDGYVRVADLALHTRQMVPGRTRQRQHPILHFEHADNFAVAYYAGGDAKPKGLPFEVEPEIEPEPGAWRQSAGVVQNVGVVSDNAAVVGSIQGGAGPIHVGGQQHYGDRITATTGSVVGTGRGVAVAGNRNVVVTGKVGGDVVAGDKVGGDKIGQDKVTTGDISDSPVALTAGSVRVARMTIFQSPVPRSSQESDVSGRTTPLIEEPIRLDVASPDFVTVGEPFDLAVAVRQPNSPLLSIDELKHVESGSGEVFRTEKDEIIRYRIELAGSGFIFVPTHYVIRLRPHEDSIPRYFEVTAQRPGTRSLVVNAFQEDESLAAQTRVRIEVVVPVRASLANFRALLTEMRELLVAMQAQGMSADESADIETELDEVEELAQRPDPPVKRIVRALENVKDILEAAGVTTAAAITAMPLVNQAIQMAQTLFAR